MKELTQEQIAAIEAEKAKRMVWVEKAKLAINSAKEDENVRVILTFLMELSGFRSNPIVITATHEVTDATIYNVGRESVFHDFRKLMSAETENLIERREE